MIWIIASLPLWVLGGCGFVLALCGIYKIVRHWRTMPVKETESAMYGLTVVLMASAVVLALAAKVAS